MASVGFRQQIVEAIDFMKRLHSSTSGEYKHGRIFSVLHQLGYLESVLVELKPGVFEPEYILSEQGRDLVKVVTGFETDVGRQYARIS